MGILFKKLNNGFTIPEYGLGAYRFGGKNERDLNNDDAADITVIQRAIDHGVTHIDTAEIYAGGHSEELVGKAIKPYRRGKLFIVSKVDPTHFAYDNVLRACEASLKRLDTDYLDLYLLHAYSKSIPLAQTIKALDSLINRGMVKYIGVSNFGVSHLQNAQHYSSNPIVANQVHYNLKVREAESRDLLTYCQVHDMMLIAWRPLALGGLRSSFLEHIPEVLHQVAQRYGKTPIQVALNWLMSQTNVVTLSKTGSAAHLEENLGACGWYLTSEDVEKLRQEFPGQQAISDVIPLSG